MLSTYYPRGTDGFITVGRLHRVVYTKESGIPTETWNHRVKPDGGSLEHSGLSNLVGRLHRRHDALWTGVFLLAAFLFGPRYGLLAQRTQRRRQRGENAARMLVVHLYNHEAKAEAAQENNVSTLRQHLRWDGAKVARVTAVSSEQGLITLGATQEKLFLTEAGRRLAREVWEPWRRG